MKRIERDKWIHFLVGIPMGIVVTLFSFRTLPQNTYLAISLSVVLVVAISYGFEIFSLLTKKGHYDFFDAVASTIGGVAGMALALVF
ncbi:MAG: hypothetical protein WAT19_15510 [Ferruginibacter sp.]